MKQPTASQERWFKIREELSGHRASLLMALSFLLPLAIWCIASYVPFIWHPDIRLEVSADRTDVSTVYTAGDHVSKEFFPTFQNAVREANQKILEDRKSGQGCIRHDGPAGQSEEAASACSARHFQWVASTQPA